MAEATKVEAPQMDRLVALGEIGAIGPPAARAVPLLVGLLDDKDAAIRGKSAEALGGIGPSARTAVDALTLRLADAGGGVRIDAAFALWRISASRLSVPALRNGLKDSDWLVRSRSATLLGLVGPPAAEAVPDLVKALRQSAPVQGSEPLVFDLDASPPRLRRPQRPDERMDTAAAIRAAAAMALGAIGLKAAAAIPALESAARSDPDRGVRGSALLALGQIAPPSKR